MVNICFSTTNQLLSRVLRWVMSSSVSHALVTYRNPVFDRVMVLEAQGRGFVSIPWRRWRKKNRLVARYSLRLPDEKVMNGLRYLSGRLGDQYDMRALIGFLFRGIIGRNFLNSPRKLLCSEAVARFLEVSGVKLPRRAGDINPKELMCFAEDHPDIFCLEEHIDADAMEDGQEAAEKLVDPLPPSHAQLIWPPPLPTEPAATLTDDARGGLRIN